MTETGRIYMVNPKDTTRYSNVVGSRYGYDKPIKGGLEFHVQGFKHTGMVQIILDEGKDCLKYILSLTLKEKEKIIEDVYFDMLVSIIDENVEKTWMIMKKGFLIHTIL